MFFQYFRDWKESRKIKKEFYNCSRIIRYCEYRTIEEAFELQGRIEQLIEEAGKFNERTSTEKISLERLNFTLCLVGEKIDDAYFGGGIPLR
jgi:hypothetical protein